MKEFCLSFLICLTYLAWLGKGETIHEQVEKIDVQIEQLKEIKRGFEGRALRAENQADRMQFDDQYRLETRRYYLIAEENRDKAAQIQKEINRLQEEKSRKIDKASL